MNKDDTLFLLIMAGLIGGMSYFGYSENKASKERIQQFNRHVSSTLRGRDLDSDVDRASIKNSRLSVENKTLAYDILNGWVNDMNAAKTIAEFDEAYYNFKRRYDIFMNGEPEKIEAVLFKYKRDRERAEKKAQMLYEQQKAREEREYERQKAKEERDFVLEKTKAYVDGLKAFKTDVNLTVNNETNA